MNALLAAMFCPPALACSAALGTSSILSGLLGGFFDVLDRLGLDFGGFRRGPRKVLEAPEAYFSMFVRASQGHCSKNVHP